MNLKLMMKEEFGIPNSLSLLYSSCKSKIAEFNRFGTLLAIGCEGAIILIMDFITKEVIRILDYNGECNLQFNNNPKNFSDYSNASYVIYDSLQYKKIESRSKRQIVTQADKEKCKAVISCLEFSSNGRYLLCCYQVTNDVIIWDIVNCTQVHKINIPNISYCRLCMHDPHVIITSGTEPSIQNLETKESVRFFSDSQTDIEFNGAVLFEDNKKKPQKEWLSYILYYKKEYYFFLVSSVNEIILLKERNPATPVGSKIPNINEERFEIIAADYIGFNGSVTSVSIDQKQTSLILLCSDRYLRLIDIIYEAKKFNLQKEIVDIVNKKKWTSASFFSESGREDYIVAGLGEYGNHEIQFMHKQTGQVYKKLSEYHEGCLYIASHTQVHESIVVVTSSGDLYLWSVKNPKGWSALAPGFNEVEENVEYIEKEDEHDFCEAYNTKGKKKQLKDIKFKCEHSIMKQCYRSIASFAIKKEYVEEEDIKSIPVTLASDSLSEKGLNTLRKLKEFVAQKRACK